MITEYLFNNTKSPSYKLQKKNILRLFNFAKLEKFWGKKIGKYFHPQKIGLNVITESRRIGKPITMYLPVAGRKRWKGRR